jgi:hypothetical protein
VDGKRRKVEADLGPVQYLATLIGQPDEVVLRLGYQSERRDFVAFAIRVNLRERRSACVRAARRPRWCGCISRPPAATRLRASPVRRAVRWAHERPWAATRRSQRT